MSPMRMTGFILGIVTLLLVSSAPTSAQTTCHSYQSGTTPPAGYAAAWNVLTSARELLLSATCTSSTATLKVGAGNSAHYIYNKGYVYTGGAWQSKTFTGTFVQNSTDWLTGTGTHTYGTPPTSATYWVGYLCQWTGDVWKCGCRDSACTTQHWMLQTFARSSGGGVATGNELALCYPASGNTKNVSNASELSSALSSANPGDHIVLASGTYSGSFALTRNGTASNPIVVRATNTANRPRITGNFTFSGSYGVLEGMEFTGSAGIVLQGDHNRATRNYIHDFSGAAIFSSTGTFNRADHNEIANQIGGGHAFHNRSPDGARDNRFDHNYVHDLPDQDQNGNEPIYTGHSSTPHRTSRVLIDRNLLVRAKAEGEVVGIKSSGNRIIGNTSIDSDGYFSNRTGDGNEWISNWIEGSEMRIHGKDITIIGNHVIGGVIQLLKGNSTPETFEAGDPSRNRQVAENVLVVGNSGGTIYLGAKYDEQTLPVKNTRLEANSASVSKVNHTGTTESASTNISFTPARKLTTSDVGLNAPDPSCQ